MHTHHTTHTTPPALVRAPPLPLHSRGGFFLLPLACCAQQAVKLPVLRLLLARLDSVVQMRGGWARSASVGAVASTQSNPAANHLGDDRCDGGASHALASAKDERVAEHHLERVGSQGRHEGGARVR